MRNRIKSLLAAVLALALVLTMLPAASRSAQAADIDGKETASRELRVEAPVVIANEPASVDPETGNQLTGHLSIKNPGSTSVTDAYLAGQASGNAIQASLPSYYNSTDYGYITPIRDQNPYGTCWAHAAIASIESYMIKYKVKDAETGKAATTSINLSESHLSWFSYTYAYDKLGMLSGDSTILYSGNDYRDVGGNCYLATYTMMRGEGPASESTSALAYGNMSSSGLSSSYAYNYNTTQVTDAIWIPKANVAAVKQAIMDYGAGVFTYFHDFNSSYYNESTGAYYCNRYTDGNHDVTVVGWDDNYSRNNFKSSCRPSKNGAWIIKNSWGTYSGKNGYYYISYEDTSGSDAACCFFKAAAKDPYQNIYQYDGTASGYYLNLGEKRFTTSTSFVANGVEDLEKVAFCTLDENTNYVVKVFLDSNTTDPTSGTLAATKAGVFTYPGYYSVNLDTPVYLSAGQRYSVVVYLYCSDGLHVPIDYTGNFAGIAKCTHKARSNTTFCCYDGSTYWEDVGSQGIDFRIKAMTSRHNPFVDVAKNKWYAEAVLWAYYHTPRITSGTDDTHFSPHDTCTRSQIVTFLWHANYDPAPGSTVNPFTDDVKPGKWYTNAVLWAYYHNPRITSGKTATSFGINNGCKREQVVTFLWNAAGAPKPKTTYCPFNDVDPTKYYYKAVLWAVENGITSGIDATTFGVGQTCTRAQIVTFLYTAYGNQ